MSNYIKTGYMNQMGFRDRREWLAAHLRNTDQKMVQLSTIIQILEQNFAALCQQIKDINYRFSSVFIGVASGNLEIPLIQKFVETRGSKQNLNFYCEDISAPMAKNFFLTPAIVVSKI